MDDDEPSAEYVADQIVEAGAQRGQQATLVGGGSGAGRPVVLGLLRLLGWRAGRTVERTIVALRCHWFGGSERSGMGIK